MDCCPFLLWCCNLRRGLLFALPVSNSVRVLGHIPLHDFAITAWFVAYLGLIAVAIVTLMFVPIISGLIVIWGSNVAVGFVAVATHLLIVGTRNRRMLGRVVVVAVIIGCSTIPLGKALSHARQRQGRHVGDAQPFVSFVAVAATSPGRNRGGSRIVRIIGELRSGRHASRGRVVIRCVVALSIRRGGIARSSALRGGNATVLLHGSSAVGGGLEEFSSVLANLIPVHRSFGRWRFRRRGLHATPTPGG
mmetsp:Transcript_40467/g.86198  ORF Transcript_40467/g.86198 Transcript_40467/m.86198 type:complete len:249 (-) Transcript_40467:143-889(-)